jgi:hypothetical protein
MAVVAGLPIPPSNVPMVDPRTGDISLQWRNYYLALQNFIASIAAAPVNAKYWLSSVNGTLTDEVNLGALPTGYLKITSAVGTATPSTVTTIPLTDITPSPPPPSAPYWTSTAVPTLSAEVNMGALATGYLKQVTAAGVATPSTTPTIPLADITPAPPPSTASYWTSTAEPALSAETNLGALATGYLKQTTVAGVATPSTTPTIPASDISPPPPTNAATYWTSTSEPGLSAETNMGALASGYLKQTTVAGVATPSTVTTIPASDISPPPPTNAASYWTSTAEPGLSNETNMGALPEGWVYQTVAAGVATPVTSQMMAGFISDPAALTGTNDVNVTITLTGFPTNALLRAVTATMGWTGILSAARGGTGAYHPTQQYTPTALNLGNVTSTTHYPCQFLQVGRVVTVSGQIDIYPTAAGVWTVLGIEVPIPSLFTGGQQCCGTAAAPGGGLFGGFIADNSSGAGRANLMFVSNSTTGAAWFFQFTYLVL